MLVASAAGQAGTTPNLLANGDAELQLCTRDWTAQTSVPGWRVLRGAASVLCYSAFQFTGESPATPQGQPIGNALFAAPGADAAIEQVVDVTAAAAGIDTGAVRFDLSGLLGGWRDRPERATLTAIFLDADGVATGDPVVIADADAKMRHNLTGLVLRRAKGTVPARTRRIAVTLQFLSGMTSFQNAYADDLSLTLSGPVGRLGPAMPVPPASAVPPLDRVIVVMMENTNYADVFHTVGGGVAVDATMPFFASLARNGVILDNIWGAYHPSDQNYVAMVAGDTYAFGPVYYPDFNLKVKHLGDLLEAKGKSWRAYVQDMKTPCALESSGAGRHSYSPDDQPFAHFANVIGDQSRCTAHLRDLGDFEAAIADNALPSFAWVAANNWWDGEGAWERDRDVAFSNARQDQFLRTTLKLLIESEAWRQSRSLLIVTWDESDGWGWPDNHIPTILVGSPGLLRAGTVLQEHVDHYDLLRTIETALRIGGLNRFDRFARPLDAAFAQGEPSDLRGARDLWPAGRLAMRGSIADTFGAITAPAAVDQGQPVRLRIPAGAPADAEIVFEPLGQVPTDAAKTFRFAGDEVSIPTARLPPGFYAAWLRRGRARPSLAPMMVTILPRPLVSPTRPGVEIVGMAEDGGHGVREGSNLVVRYCLPAGADPAKGWIGIFPSGTPPKDMTRNAADEIGYWLKTPGSAGGKPGCGEAEAYSSELTPDQDYQVVLFSSDGGPADRPVGRTTDFRLTPSLPH